MCKIFKFLMQTFTGLSTQRLVQLKRGHFSRFRLETFIVQNENKKMYSFKSSQKMGLVLTFHRILNLKISAYIQDILT